MFSQNCRNIACKAGPTQFCSALLGPRPRKLLARCSLRFCSSSSRGTDSAKAVTPSTPQPRRDSANNTTARAKAMLSYAIVCPAVAQMHSGIVQPLRSYDLPFMSLYRFSLSVFQHAKHFSVHVNHMNHNHTLWLFEVPETK